MSLNNELGASLAKAHQNLLGYGEGQGGEQVIVGVKRRHCL